MRATYCASFWVLLYLRFIGNINGGIPFGRHGNDCDWMLVEHRLHGRRDAEIGSNIAKCITRITNKYHHFDNEIFSHEFGCEDKDSFLSFHQTYSFLRDLAYGNGTGHFFLRGSSSNGNNNASNMSIFLIGDSLMREQFFFLSCLLDLDATIVNSNKTYTYSWGTQAHRWRMSQSGHLRIVYFEWGSLFTSRYGDILREDLSKALYESHPNDVILINEGIHVRLDKLSVLGQLVHGVRDIYLDVRRDRVEKIPFVIWRESTPQNFPSPNGWYIAGICDKPATIATCHCVPLTPEMISSNNSIQVPANMRNIIAYEVLKSGEIFYDLCFDPLAIAPFNTHTSFAQGDCTHLGFNGVAFLTQVLASTILENFEKRLK